MRIFKKLILVLIGLGLTSQLSACSDEGIEKVEDEVFAKMGPCPITVPKQMRKLRKTYNKEFSAPDSEGNSQSYETCWAQIEAAKKFQRGLIDLLDYMDESCKDFHITTANKIDVDNYKKIAKTVNDLDRQMKETDCESIYGNNQ